MLKLIIFLSRKFLMFFSEISRKNKFPSFLIIFLLVSGCATFMKTTEKKGVGVVSQDSDHVFFRKAMKEHTSKSYKNYIKNYPNGKFIRRAKYWFEKLSYEEALGNKNLNVLSKFLKKFSKGNFASKAEIVLQRREFEIIRKKESIKDYDRFLKKNKKKISEWTEVAQQRLERLTLDTARRMKNPKLFYYFIYDFPFSPYVAEAKKHLVQIRFQRSVDSRLEREWKNFLKEFPYTEQAKRMKEHIQNQALRGAEKSGRVGALVRFLRLYPKSIHRSRILSAVTIMTRQRDRNFKNWVTLDNLELTLSRPRKCKTCSPRYLIKGLLKNSDADFAFNVILQASLKKARSYCCFTNYKISGLKPGEKKFFSFFVKKGKKVPVLNKAQFSVRILSGKAFHNPSWSKVLQIQGLGTKGENVDSFSPKKVRSLER